MLIQRTLAYVAALVSEHDPASVPTDLVGSVVADRYRILALLGQGSMGRVYAAWHLGLDQRVAFKLLRRGPNGEVDGVARQRFQREARAAARIRSDHVCHVIDNGTLEDGTPFLVMEYLEGCDLAHELRRRARLPIHEAVRYVRQACSALAEAHRAGIVHRDLKPANLFLEQTTDSLDPSSDGRRIKVLDFGISKANAHPGTPNLSLTRTAALLGSPVYMSPEQLNSSRDVDSRSDVWALGVILYELITGQRPFDQASIGQLVNAVLHREPPPCASHGVPVPRALEIILDRALRKDRQLRYQTAAEFSLALAPFEREPLVNAALSETLPLPRALDLAPLLEAEDERTTSARLSTTQLLAARPSRPPPARRPKLRWGRGVVLSLLAIAVGLGVGRTLLPPTRVSPVPRVPAVLPKVGTSAPSALPSIVPESLEIASDDWLLASPPIDLPSQPAPPPVQPALRDRVQTLGVRSAGGLRPQRLPAAARPQPSSAPAAVGEFGGRR